MLLSATITRLPRVASILPSGIVGKGGQLDEALGGIHFEAAIALAGRVMEAAGVAIIVLGAAIATVRFAAGSRSGGGGDGDGRFRAYRQGLGQAILLGLEFLVAGDIIRTVAVEPDLESLAVLAGIVLIRTFLSCSLEVEITGRWPWQQGQEAGRTL